MGLRIELDEVLCQGHGVCEGEAPDVFSLSKKGELTILQPNPDESLRPQVEAAVKYCPTHALKLIDDPEV
jgi:ferredoxin